MRRRHGAAATSVHANGTVVLMGGLGVDVALPYRWIMRNNITIVGQWMYLPQKFIARRSNLSLSLRPENATIVSVILVPIEMSDLGIRRHFVELELGSRAVISRCGD